MSLCPVPDERHTVVPSRRRPRLHSLSLSHGSGGGRPPFDLRIDKPLKFELWTQNRLALSLSQSQIFFSWVLRFLQLCLAAIWVLICSELLSSEICLAQPDGPNPTKTIGFTDGFGSSTDRLRVRKWSTRLFRSSYRLGSNPTRADPCSLILFPWDNKKKDKYLKLADIFFQI